MALADFYKTTKDINGLEGLVEIINSKLGDKYEVILSKKDTGAKKFLTGNDTDFIKIKKNAYHGITMSITEKADGIDYSVIGVGGYTPNMMVNQVLGKTGVVDVLVAKLIFGSGKQFYSDIEKVILEDAKGQEVDNSFKNNVKSMFKGKSIFDETAAKKEE